MQFWMILLQQEIINQLYYMISNMFSQFEPLCFGEYIEYSMLVMTVEQVQNKKLIYLSKESLHPSVYVPSPHNEAFDVVEKARKIIFSSHHFSLQLL